MIKDHDEDIILGFKNEILTSKYITVVGYLNKLGRMLPSPLQILWKAVDITNTCAPIAYYRFHEFRAQNKYHPTRYMRLQRNVDDSDGKTIYKSELYSYIQNKKSC